MGLRALPMSDGSDSTDPVLYRVVGLLGLSSQYLEASFDQGRVPSDWKMAFVTPIFKKGNRNTAENYRPVSLTSIYCKLAEHIIHCNAMRYLEELRILTDSQHI